MIQACPRCGTQRKLTSARFCEACGADFEQRPNASFGSSESDPAATVLGVLLLIAVPVLLAGWLVWHWNLLLVVGIPLGIFIFGAVVWAIAGNTRGVIFFDD
jgi:uncharacterized protein (DUF983 family)